MKETVPNLGDCDLHKRKRHADYNENEFEYKIKIMVEERDTVKPDDLGVQDCDFLAFASNVLFLSLVMI